MTRMSPARRFFVTVTFDLTAEQRLIARGMSKEFAEIICPLPTPERVAEHLAYNLMQHTDVSSLDGFADIADGDKMAELEWRTVVVEAEEVASPPKRKRRAVRK